MDRSEIKVLIVEDEPIIAADLRSLLKHEGFKVAGVANKASKALDILANRHPNFAILDIHLGSGQSGIDIAEIIHEKYHIPYIFLTSFSDDATLHAAQEQGPYGYLVKPFQDKTLVTTIATAWQNYQRILRGNDQKIDQKIFNLTSQEKTICKHLLRGGSYKQICAELHISMNTLKFHVKNIYQKMNVASRSALSSLLS